MAAVGAMVRWTPMPLKTPLNPGSLVVTLDVDITKFIAHMQILEREIALIAAGAPGRLLHATINLHLESTKTEKGHGLELSCDTEWSERNDPVSVFQYSHGPRPALKA